MNNNSPLVSILMPVYNTACYLREAIDSMLNQTFRDFELIVLNDCSPDNAEEILDTYNDSRIVRYRGQKNQGLANVLNIGMDMARGKYIARMDSDDISLPNRLKVQVDYLESHPDIDLCSVGMQLFGSKSEVWSRPSDAETTKIIALFYSPILHASSLWRKESFDRYELRFRQEMVPAEDYDMWCRGLSIGLQMVNIADVLYKYRIRPEQATANTEKSNEKVSVIRKEYFRQAFSGMTDDLVDSFVNWKSCSISQLRTLLVRMLLVNSKENFFNRKILLKRLVKFYLYRKRSI